MVVKAYSLEFRNGGILSKMVSSCLQEGFSQLREISVGFQVSVDVNMGGFHDGRGSGFPTKPCNPGSILSHQIPKEPEKEGEENWLGDTGFPSEGPCPCSECQRKYSQYDDPLKKTRRSSLISILV